MILTRRHFADNARRCITEVEEGRVILPGHTPFEKYAAECHARAAEYMAGTWDHTLTFLQRAAWIQTGIMVALLP